MRDTRDGWQVDLVPTPLSTPPRRIKPSEPNSKSFNRNFIQW